MSTRRAQREIAHGEWLSGRDPEHVWGWSTPAGRVRAQRRAGLIARAAALRPGMRVLEVGCGTGLFTEAFARTGATILAVDLAEPLLARARSRGLAPERVSFLRRPFEECSALGPFDAVVGSSVLHHLDSRRTFPQIFELLRPGGRMAFAEPNMLNPQIALQKNVPWIKKRMGDSPDETAFVRWTVKRALRRAGYEEIDVRPFDWLHPMTPAVLIPVVSLVGTGVERVPLVREFAGSLLIRAVKPGARA